MKILCKLSANLSHFIKKIIKGRFLFRPTVAGPWVLQPIHYIIYRCQKRVCHRDKRQSLLLLLYTCRRRRFRWRCIVQYLCGKFCTGKLTPGATFPHHANGGGIHAQQQYAACKYLIRYYTKAIFIVRLHINNNV